MGDTSPRLSPQGTKDYIMGHNAGALWDQMSADKD